MPRSARIVLSDTPHHIVQRGHNRQRVFFTNDDYRYYLDNLIYFKQEYCCRIYAYCLMSNHVHLIIDPCDDPEGLSRLMKRVAGRQTRRVNSIMHRTGSLWEGRFKSSIIATREYLPLCCRYIELNPLRAGMVRDPADYRWSSYPRKAQGRPDPAVDLPSFYFSLGKNQQERQVAYTRYVSGTIPDAEIKLIRNAVQRGQVTGSEHFQEELSRRTGLSFSNRGPGRPKRRLG